jgi:hypothetical protein
MTCNGFVYLWYDKDKKMFYLGSHGGLEGDGYICSSKNMLKEYRKRPNSFKRRIIERCYNNNLLETEQKWLNLIKSEELLYNKGIYYNIKRFAAGGDTLKYHIDRNKLIKKRYGKKHSDAIKFAIKNRTPEAKILHQTRRIKSLKQTYSKDFLFYQSKAIDVFCNSVLYGSFTSILDAARILKCDYSTFKKNIKIGMWVIKHQRRHPFKVGDLITFNLIIR